MKFGRMVYFGAGQKRLDFGKKADFILAKNLSKTRLKTKKSPTI